MTAGALLALTLLAALLPGEDGTKPALGPYPFPDRISAYVWRNWGHVDKGVLARTVGATPDELTAVAAEMGLDPDPEVLPEWRTKGYITVLRRNWHLLPYDQLLQVLGLTRGELDFRLKEDDFLWVKLGRIKPKCPPLVWNDGGATTHTARRRIAARLKANGFDPSAPEEPRFSFIRGIAAADPGFKLPPPAADSPFDFRLIFSYFADYADPLADPEIGSYPEGLLQKLAAEGVNAVWLHTVLSTLAKDPKYPEFGAGCERRIANLRTLVARAARYGIRVYLYMNEPRFRDAAFFTRPGREEIRGVEERPDTIAMCTSTPEVRRWLRESVRSVFSQVKGLGGIFTITMSENLTSCASHCQRDRCARCRGRTTGEIVAEVNAELVGGMLEGDPSAEALVWNWGWPADEEGAILAGLPKRSCRVMAVSENDMVVGRSKAEIRENDYSISVVGPGERALRLWSHAQREGIRTVAKVQANCSWELASFPYLPVMDLVAEHACNLASAGVNGVMLSWSCGCAPAPNLDVFRELRRGEKTVGPVLDRLATARYGAAAAPAVRRAWTAFSEGFRNFPFDITVCYSGPQQWGPANPLYWTPSGYEATMVGMPYDGFSRGAPGRIWRGRYTEEEWLDLRGKVADGFAAGCRLFESALAAMPSDRRREAERELGLFRAEQLHFRSSVDQAQFIQARDRGDRAEMRRLAAAELETAKALLPLVRADSRIGYECSNHYFYLPRDIGEKILTCLEEPVVR